MAEVETNTTPAKPGGFKKKLETFFKINENQSSIKTEILAGITSFMTMAYIIIVNPTILSNEYGANQEFSAILFSTVIISFLMSVVMGFLSNNPYAVAPGMGLNAYISFSLIGGGTFTWEQAMGAIIIAGALLTIMSLTPISSGVLKAIPKNLRFGLAAGIGVFLVFIGLHDSNFIVANEATLVAMNTFNLEMGLFLFGLLFTALLMIKKVPGSFLIGIFVTSIIGIILSFSGLGVMIDPSFNAISFKDETGKVILMSTPNIDTFFRFSFKGLWKPAIIIPIFTLAFTDLFDSVSTFLGVSEVGGLLDEDGNPKNFKGTLVADSLTTMMSGFFGTSDATTYIESAAGVEQGGRTGLTAIITGLCFLPFMFFSPLLKAIPSYATSPILILLGVLMFKPLMGIDWSDLEEALPAFIAVMMIPFTYSITNGIVFGIIIYVFIKVIVGKIKEINPWLWITFVFAIFALIAPLF
ncbi:MAG: NCS2 family permease [Promethearchaeia archaeon]|nr:MAG: NCS2 family permease [Candidatus Lokiarchaeia archaeon]